MCMSRMMRICIQQISTHHVFVFRISNIACDCIVFDSLPLVNNIRLFSPKKDIRTKACNFCTQTCFFCALFVWIQSNAKGVTTPGRYKNIVIFNFGQMAIDFLFKIILIWKCLGCAVQKLQTTTDIFCFFSDFGVATSK